MRRSISFTVVALAIAVASAILPMTPANGSPRRAAPLNCSLVSAGVLEHLLGVTIGKPTTTAEGTTVSCHYRAATGIVILQYTTGFSTAAFRTEVREDDAHGEETTALSGLGAPAVAITVDKVLTGLALVKGGDGFLVTAITSLARLEAIARVVVPHL